MDLWDSGSYQVREGGLVAKVRDLSAMGARKP